MNPPLDPPSSALRISRRGENLGTENAFVVLAEVNGLVRQGKDIVSFCIGQPDFPTPSNIQDAGVAAIRTGKHGYTPSAGIDDLRAAAARDMERAFAGATVSYDRRERSSSGELRWVRITLFPDREPGGKTGGAFVVINDIEDDVRIREALKSQEAQLRLFADNIPGPIAYLDKKLKYTFVNQAFANWVCRPQDQIYGMCARPRISVGVTP